MAENYPIRGSDLNEFNLGIIYGLYHYAGWKPTQISEQTNIPLSTTKNFCQATKGRPIDHLSNRENCGRSRSTSSTTDRRIVRASGADPFRLSVVEEILRDRPQFSLLLRWSIGRSFVAWQRFLVVPSGMFVCSEISVGFQPV